MSSDFGSPSDEVLVAGDDAADGRAQPLAQTHADAVAVGHEVAHADARPHGGVEEARAVAVQRQPVRPADLGDLADRAIIR